MQALFSFLREKSKNRNRVQTQQLSRRAILSGAKHPDFLFIAQEN
jgi:hypothetical protein